MKTTRIVLKVPFYKHPAQTVFEVAETTEPADWPDDERAREKLNFSGNQVYRLPDGGRGFAVSLPVSDTSPCPEHAFEGEDLRHGECRITAATTRHHDPTRTGAPPCGQLREEQVTVRRHESLPTQTIYIDLPPFEAVAEKMELWDSLRGTLMLDYVLRNYKPSDTQLDWDVSDLYPGFFELRILFPGGWHHSIRMIKFFPHPLDLKNPIRTPQSAWQPVTEGLREKFADSPAPVDLANEALSLCLEWGPMFNQPTQERMMERHPELSREKADELDRQAREVRSFVYNLCEKEMTGDLDFSDLHFTVKRQYPWVNTPNFNQMVNVGRYYARR